MSSETWIQVLVLIYLKQALIEMGDISYFDNYNGKPFDGIILSNVLDVMPKDIALKTFKGLTKLLAPKGLMFVKLNPFYEKTDMKQWGFTQIKDNLFEENGILRYREIWNFHILGRKA